MTIAAGTVLIVDDSAEDTELLRAAFETVGAKARVVAVRDVNEAESYFLGKAPHEDRRAAPLPNLVLLDIQMPGSDGFTFLRWLREQKGMAWHRVPVIMLTTSHDYVEIRKSYDLGANSFLVKPTGFDELCKLVMNVVEYWLRFNRFE